ncbi:MAG: hypothetical protein NTU53_03410, partial [Planctomycetota bacterium]|nr:hypothetical protein [Planctomycetota bacterium]
GAAFIEQRKLGVDRGRRRRERRRQGRHEEESVDDRVGEARVLAWGGEGGYIFEGRGLPDRVGWAGLRARGCLLVY